MEGHCRGTQRLQQRMTEVNLLSVNQNVSAKFRVIRLSLDNL